MDSYDILLNVLIVTSFTIITARIANYSQESATKKAETDREELRRLHISALMGDKVAAAKWSSRQK